jgi:hypothetical protein
MLQQNSQELPKDGTDKGQNMSELKEDELTKSVCYLLVNKK